MLSVADPITTNRYTFFSLNTSGSVKEIFFPSEQFLKPMVRAFRSTYRTISPPSGTKNSSINSLFFSPLIRTMPFLVVGELIKLTDS